LIAKPARLAAKQVFVHGHLVQGHPSASPAAVQREGKANARREASKRVFLIFVEEFLTAYVKAYPSATPEEGKDAASEHWIAMPMGERAVYEALAACQVAHTIPEHVRLALRRKDQGVVRKGKPKQSKDVGVRLGYVENGLVVADGGAVLGRIEDAAPV